MTVKPDDQLEGCMAMMRLRAAFAIYQRRTRARSWARSSENVVKDIIRNLEHNVGDLMGYIMTDGPGG